MRLLSFLFFSFPFLSSRLPPPFFLLGVRYPRRWRRFRVELELVSRRL